MANKSGNICSICLTNNDKMLTTNCNHYFHKECLDKWRMSCSKNKNPFSCPVCRKEICVVNKQNEIIKRLDYLSRKMNNRLNLLFVIIFTISIFVFQLKFKFEYNVLILLLTIFIHFMVFEFVNNSNDITNDITILLIFVRILIITQFFVIFLCFVLVTQLIIISPLLGGLCIWFIITKEDFSWNSFLLIYETL